MNLFSSPDLGGLLWLKYFVLEINTLFSVMFDSPDLKIEVHWFWCELCNSIISFVVCIKQKKQIYEPWIYSYIDFPLAIFGIILAGSIYYMEFPELFLTLLELAVSDVLLIKMFNVNVKTGLWESNELWMMLELLAITRWQRFGWSFN